MKTCIEHIAPAARAPFHDIRYCQCLLRKPPVLAERKVVSGARWQPEFIDDRLAELEAFIEARK